jgi:hypothetical protein
MVLHSYEPVLSALVRATQKALQSQIVVHATVFSESIASFGVCNYQLWT